MSYSIPYNYKLEGFYHCCPIIDNVDVKVSVLKCLSKMVDGHSAKVR